MKNRVFVRNYEFAVDIAKYSISINAERSVIERTFMLQFFFPILFL
jgi:hypothetical protein